MKTIKTLITVGALAAVSSFAFAKSGDIGVRLGNSSINFKEDGLSYIEIGATYQLDQIRLGLDLGTTSYGGYSGSNFGLSADYIFLDKPIDKTTSYYVLGGTDIKLSNIINLNFTVLSIQGGAGIKYTLDKSIGLFAELGLNAPIVNQVSSSLVSGSFSNSISLELRAGATFR